AEAKAAAAERQALSERLTATVQAITAEQAAQSERLHERLNGVVEAQTDRLLAGQIDPLALRDALGEIVRTTQDAGIEPMLAGLDRLEQQQVRQQDGYGRLAEQLEALEQSVRAGGALQAGFQALQAQVERLEGIIRAPSPDGAKLDQLAIALKRVETGLASGPNVDSRLTVMQAQISRIEEGAGAITPELLEVLAARLEAVDPRPGFTRVDDKFAALAEALEWVAETVEKKLESRLGEATPLAGRLARLEQAVAERATGAELNDGLDEIARSLDALLTQQPALAERLEDHTAQLTAAQEAVAAVGAQVAELPDPRPALGALAEGVSLRLEALAERLGQGNAPVLERLEDLNGRLDAVGERLGQVPDPAPALARIEDNLDRLDRRVRSEGNQAERAVTAAMAVVQSLDVSEPLEAIEDRLRRMERGVGEGGAISAGGADLGPLLDRLDALGPDGALAERLGDLEARLAT
ncbi:MAG: hypothetical protein KC613_15945, partial [Myxococcales bacterium]|nr:hypothetical protein [Myxococcales bacterium]